jgi:hypothetical protein
MSRNRAVTSFDDVKRLTAHLRGVSESTSYGTPSLTVGGKSFCRLWGEREYERYGVSDTEVLVVFCDLDEKAALIETSGGSVFTTAHYDGHGAVLIRLGHIDPEDLADLLELSYRQKAPTAFLRDQDGP